MKNVPVIVIRNRDKSRSAKYRIRNLLTDEICYSNSVTLANPQYIPNVNGMKNLKAEQTVFCNWALSGSLTSLDAVNNLPNKTAVNTTEYGFMIAGDYYYESDHGSLDALHFGEDSENRFVWLNTPLKK